MNTISTSSFKTFILDKGEKKTVRQYKIGYKGAHAYPRTVPINKIYKVIDKSNFKHPKMLKNGFKYIDIEYIDGNNLKKEDDPNIMKGLITSFVYGLAQIDCSPLKKYRFWTNNTEFLEYQVNNMLRIMSVNKAVFDKVELTEKFFDKFKGVKLDDNRFQRLIHCDIKPENVMYTATDYYLIDWELACYGDLAYELAMHFKLMEYDEVTINELLAKIAASLGENLETLTRDVKIYMEFEDVRKAFTAINNVVSNIKRRTEGFDSIIDKNIGFYNKLVPHVDKEELIKRIVME